MTFRFRNFLLQDLRDAGDAAAVVPMDWTKTFELAVGLLGISCAVT